MTNIRTLILFAALWTLVAAIAWLPACKEYKKSRHSPQQAADSIRLVNNADTTLHSGLQHVLNDTLATYYFDVPLNVDGPDGLKINIDSIAGVLRLTLYREYTYERNATTMRRYEYKKLNAQRTRPNGDTDTIYLPTTSGITSYW